MRFQKGKGTVTVRMVRCLQGIVCCPKPTPALLARLCNVAQAVPRSADPTRSARDPRHWISQRCVSLKHLTKALRINLISDGTSGASRNRAFQWDSNTWASGRIRLRFHPNPTQKRSIQLLSGDAFGAQNQPLGGVSCGMAGRTTLTKIC